MNFKRESLRRDSLPSKMKENDYKYYYVLPIPINNQL